jgi:hypothetical protein
VDYIGKAITDAFTEKVKTVIDYKTDLINSQSAAIIIELIFQ